MINVLVLCGDKWHPGEVIQLGLKDLQDKEFHFDYIEDAKDILTEEMIARYPVIMNCKHDHLISGSDVLWLSDEEAEVGAAEFEKYVRRGGGFLSVHAGNTASQEVSKKYADFVGNNFVTHPRRCNIEVSVTKPHPVAEGVADFTIRDEHYQMVGIAEDADIFLKSTSETGGVQVAGYTRTMGEGRICALMPGHTLPVWEHPMFRKLLVNALHWCIKSETE